MIPTAILLGMVAGPSPLRWWAVPLIGVIWSLMLALWGDPAMTSLQVWLGGFALGALNAALGVLVSSRAVRLLRTPFRSVNSDYLEAK
jgi:hypothetical protein